jgi:hypothetical protein
VLAWRVLPWLLLLDFEPIVRVNPVALECVLWQAGKAELCSVGVTPLRAIRKSTDITSAQHVQQKQYKGSNSQLVTRDPQYGSFSSAADIRKKIRRCIRHSDESRMRPDRAALTFLG